MSTQSRSPLPSAAPHPQPDQHAPAFEGEDQAQAAIIHRAEEVIGDRSDAMRWLGTPVRALNYATPISLLHDSRGREEVLAVLGRIEHGVL
jgi:putative toxin-antitoxin system antitoxin component (TIGR02293 family)